MTIPAECITRRSDPEIVFKENRSRFVVLNPHRQTLDSVRVDGCAITSGIRCDFLIQNGVQAFIELKGSDVKHAVEQLVRSMEKLADKKKKMFCFIVSTRCPLISTEIQKFKREFRKEWNADLQIKNGVIIWEVPGQVKGDSLRKRRSR